MTENINTNNSVDIFENVTVKKKELSTKFGDNFKQFNTEMYELFKKEGEGCELSEEQVLKGNKQLFNSIQAKNIESLNNELLDVSDTFFDLYKVVLSNLPTVGPLFQFVFSFFGGNPLEQLYKEILRKVEEMVKKAIEVEARRQCEIIFQNLQSIGEKHKELTQRWYDTNGVKSFSLNGQEIKSTSNEFSTLASSQLESMIHASFLDYRNELIKALNHFSEPRFFGHTITLYMYTAVIYSAFLKDVMKYGSAMNFPPEIINGTSNVPSLKKEHNNFITQAVQKMTSGCLAYTQMINDIQEGYWINPGHGPPLGGPPMWVEPPHFDWVGPPGLKIGLNLYFSNLDLYPNGITVLTPNSLKQYSLDSSKGDFFINLSDLADKVAYPLSTYPSFHFGSYALYPSGYVATDREVLIKNGGYNRKFSIDVYHKLVREAYWKIECYNNSPGESGSFSKEVSKLIRASTSDPLQIENKDCGINRLFESVSINHQWIKLTCMRKGIGSIPRGYQYTSQIYSIRIINE
ncbi:hypothetical protein ACTFIV_008607 [Dictyostelium citrinum]